MCVLRNLRKVARRRGQARPSARLMGAKVQVGVYHLPMRQVSPSPWIEEKVARGEYVPTADQRVILNGVSWQQLEAQFELPGDSGPRLTYLDGAMELMSPSKDH
jgi:hypothetical protein